MSCLNYLLNRGVTRLCHFTKLKDLTHILLSDDGIVSSTAIRPDVKDQKDPERYDGELDYVCCSIEYPITREISKTSIRKSCPNLFLKCHFFTLLLQFEFLFFCKNSDFLFLCFILHR